MSDPTFYSPQHFDGELGTPSIHLDLHYDPGAGHAHTLRAAVVSVDGDSPIHRVVLSHENGWDSYSPFIAGGTTATFSQADLNSLGFNVIENVVGITGMSI